MSKPKKLDLPIRELTKIALAINENTIANRNRSKEEKITSDTFIRQFGINRKNFSETIKDTSIEYNKPTFQYIIDGLNNRSETLVVKGETLEANVAIVEFENMKSGLVEMLEWYKGERKKENIIDIEMPIISIDKEKLTELAVTRGFKIYPDVVAQFKAFCKQNSQYNMQDLMAMSLIEYMSKYSE